MNNLKKKATLSILLMVSMGHLLNDMFQSVIPSIYPIIKESLSSSRHSCLCLASLPISCQISRNEYEIIR